MPLFNRQKLKRFFMLLLCAQIFAACSGWGGDLSLLPRGDHPSVLQNSESSNLKADAQPQLVNNHQVPVSFEQRWIVSATEAKQLIEQGATLLDVRRQGLTTKRLHGAIAVHWKHFSPQEAIARGRLLDDDDRLTQRLQALGISTHTPVVVFGNPPHGWGEEGRIVWMLRTLGHSQAVLVDGGFQALMSAQVPLQKGTVTTPQPGDFVVQRDTSWDIQRDDLRDTLNVSNLVIIDTREPREFAGKTPYGEQRGGHIPGAVNLYFKEFLRQDGRLLEPQAIRTRLQALGITSDTQIVVYCTGGIRSGWLTSVFVTLGFSVKNYAGSMWEWSAAAAEQYPLETLGTR